MFEESIVPTGSDVVVGSKGDNVTYATSSTSLYTSSLAKSNLQRRVQEALDMNIDHNLIEACKYINKLAPEFLEDASASDVHSDSTTQVKHEVMTNSNSITTTSSNMGEELEQILEKRTLARYKEFLRSFANVHDAYQRVNAQINQLEHNVSELSHVLLSRQDDISAFCNKLDIMEEEKRGVQYHNQVIKALTEQYQFGQKEEQLLCSESAEVNEQFLDVLERARALHTKSKELMLNTQTYNSEIGVMLESVYTVIVIAVDKIVHYLLSTAMVSSNNNEPVPSTHSVFHLHSIAEEYKGSSSSKEQTMQTLSLLTANGSVSEIRSINFAQHHKRTLGASLAADEPEVSSFYVHCIHIVHEENVEQWEHIINEIVKLRQASLLRRYYHLLSTGSTTTQSGTYYSTHKNTSGNPKNKTITRKNSLLVQKGFTSNKGENNVNEEEEEDDDIDATDEAMDDERVGTRPLELEMSHPVYFFSALFAWLHQCIVQEADFYSHFCDDGDKEEAASSLLESKYNDEPYNGHNFTNVLPKSNSPQMELFAGQGSEKSCNNNKIANRTNMLDNTFDHITSHVDKDLTKIIQHLKRTSLIHTHVNKQSRKSPLTNSFITKTTVSPPSQSVTQPQLSMPSKHDTTHKTAQNNIDANKDSNKNNETSSSSLSLNRKSYKPLGPRGLTGSLSRFFRAATGRPAALQTLNNSLSSSTTTNINNDKEYNNMTTKTNDNNATKTNDTNYTEHDVAQVKCDNANTHIHQRSNTTESKCTKLSSVSPSSLELSVPVAAELPITASVPSPSFSLSISLPSSSLPSSALITGTPAATTTAIISNALSSVTSPAFHNDVIESAIDKFREVFAQTNTINSFAHTSFSGHVDNANSHTNVYKDRVHDIRTKMNKISNAWLSRLLHGVSTLFMLLELFNYYDRITFRPLLSQTSTLTKFLQCDAPISLSKLLMSFVEECEMHLFDSLIGLTSQLPILSEDNTNISSSCNKHNNDDYNTGRSKQSMFVLEYFVFKKKEVATTTKQTNAWNNYNDNNSNNSSMTEMLSKSMSIDREPSNTRSRLSLSLSLRPGSRSELHLNASVNNNNSIASTLPRPSSSSSSLPTLFTRARPDELLYVYESVVLQIPSEVKLILTELKKIIRDAAHNAEIMKNIDEKDKQLNRHVTENAREENSVELYVCRMINMIARYGVLLKQHPFLRNRLDDVCMDTLSLNILNSLKEVLESESMYISTLSACNKNKAINVIDNIKIIIHELQESLYDTIVTVLEKYYFANASMLIQCNQTRKAITSSKRDDNQSTSSMLSSAEIELIQQEFTRFYALIASDGHVPLPPLVTSLNNAKEKRIIEERLTTYFCAKYKELYDCLMTEGVTQSLDDKTQHSLHEITPSQLYVLADLEVEYIEQLEKEK